MQINGTFLQTLYSYLAAEQYEAQVITKEAEYFGPQVVQVVQWYDPLLRVALEATYNTNGTDNSQRGTIYARLAGGGVKPVLTDPFMRGASAALVMAQLYGNAAALREEYKTIGSKALPRTAQPGYERHIVRPETYEWGGRIYQNKALMTLTQTLEAEGLDGYRTHVSTTGAGRPRVTSVTWYEPSCGLVLRGWTYNRTAFKVSALAGQRSVTLWARDNGGGCNGVDILGAVRSNPLGNRAAGVSHGASQSLDEVYNKGAGERSRL